jgi:hypothetical protein
VQDGADSLALKVPQADRKRSADALDALRVYLGAHGLANVGVRLDADEPQESRDGKLRQVVCRK